MLTILAALSVLLPAAPGARKCVQTLSMPGYDRNEPVILVDGVIWDGDAEDLRSVDIYSIEVTCWDPQRDEFVRGAAGVQVLNVVSKDLVRITRAPLLKLVAAQEAFHERNARYAPTLGELVPFGLPEGMELKFTGTDDDWSASTPTGDIAYRCSADHTSAADPDADGAPRLECAYDEARALRSIRELHDAGW